MIDRSELMEAALESFPEGLALLDREGKVNFWNRAAENITGFPGIETVTRTIPGYLEPLLLKRLPEGGEDRTAYRPRTQRPDPHSTPVRARFAFGDADCSPAGYAGRTHRFGCHISYRGKSGNVAAWGKL